MDRLDRYTNPPFRITRTSHVRLTVRDLDASCAFYQKLGGLLVTERTADTAYLRGIEETSHHSLVLRRSDEAATCDAIGFRVFQDTDLDAAKTYFDNLGEITSWGEQHGAGRMLTVRHSSGIVFELVAAMDRQPRELGDYQNHKGGRALRIDHVQVVVPEVDAIGTQFEDLGFRASEIIMQADGGDARIGLFLHRKNNPHDLVLATGAGPRLHHFAFITPDLQTMIRACDVAGTMGIGQEVERGPGRHGPGNSMFCYFRDPDGHRMELILAPMQYMDAEEAPQIWNVANRNMIMPWGGPAPKRWLEEATHFTGVPLSTAGSLARWASR